MRSWWLIGVLMVGACIDTPGYMCRNAAACAPGWCESNGSCSFSAPTSECPSGRRYGELGDPSVAGTCVDVGVRMAPGPDGGGGPPPPPPPNTDAGPLPLNQVTNSTFEVDLSGWDSNNATLTRTAGGHSGGWACTVCSTSSEYTIDDYPNTAPNAQPGETYVADAWVRVTTGTQNLTLVVRERNGVDTLDSRQSIAADGTWREINVTHTVTLSGASVDIYLGNLDGPTGCFDVDDLTMGH
jgi:hypothetical protein